VIARCILIKLGNMKYSIDKFTMKIVNKTK